MEKKLAVLTMDYAYYDLGIDDYDVTNCILAIGDTEALKSRASKAINTDWHNSIVEENNERIYSDWFQLENVVKEDPWYNEIFKELIDNNEYVDPYSGEHIQVYKDFRLYISLYPVVE